MNRQVVLFSGERRIDWVEEPLPDPQGQQLLVQSRLSAISGGSELLVYRNQIPRDLRLDASIPGLDSDFAYPTKYGYSVVGEVVDASGSGLKVFIGQRVFAFHPHESHFWISPENIIPLPDGLPEDTAAFLPNMETAVNLVQDGQPILGEVAAVFGQGVVGLLTTSILAGFPLQALAVIDPLSFRRDLAAQLGAHICLDPSSSNFTDSLSQYFDVPHNQIFDLSFELSGSPDSLNQAIYLSRFNARIVVGSWYGTKRADLDLGGVFHRNRIRLLSSQVSTIDPSLRGRWDKKRRFQWAWSMLETIDPTVLITHRFPASQADEAFRMLDTRPEKTVQVLLTYP